MPVEQTTVQGTIYGADGNAIAGGKIRLVLSQPGTTPDTVSSASERVAGDLEVAIGGNGAVNFTVVPNDVITPAGTLYLVTFTLPDGFTWREYWDVGTSPDPLDIGDVNRVAGPSVDALTPSIPSVTSLPTPTAAWHKKKLILIQAGIPDQEVTCLDDGTGTFGWAVSAIGG